jgi:hypothetical protein
MPTTTTMSSTAAHAGKLEFETMVAERKDALVIEGGYSKEDADGNDVADYVAFKTAGQVILAGTQIDDVDDAPKGLTNVELLEKVLPDVEYDLDDPVDAAAWAALAKRIGAITQPNPTGFVQRALPKGLVLISMSTFRPSGRVKVAFVTTDENIILDHSLQPVIDQVLKEAVKLHSQATMIVDRKPELAAPVRKAITSGTKRAQATAALPAGDDA